MLKNDVASLIQETPDKLKFKKLYNVSRGTTKLLEVYEDYLLKENKKHNLIGSGTVNCVWIRHFADSAKLFLIKGLLEAKEKNLKICDIGSGAGFPGLVMKIFSMEFNLNCDITLFESNSKKISFLKKMVRSLNLNVNIKSLRIEETNQKFDIIICRAVASLLKIIRISKNCRKKDSLLVLPKGKNWSKELNEVKKNGILN